MTRVWIFIIGSIIVGVIAWIYDAYVSMKKDEEIARLRDELTQRDSKLSKLKELKMLLDDGTLNENEFELMKYELINNEQEE